MVLAAFTLALSASPAAPQLVEKVSAPLVRSPELGGDVLDLKLAAGGAVVVLLGEIENDDDLQLYSVPFTGGPLRRLSARTTGGGPYAAVNYQPAPGTNRVVYWTDQEVLGRYELFSVRLDGSQPPVRLHAPLEGELDAAYDFQVAGARVVFRSEATLDGRFEVYSAPVDGSAPALLLGPALVTGGSVGASEYGTGTLAVTPSGDRAVFLADALVDGRVELFSVPVDGSAGAVRLSSTPPSGGNVTSFVLTPDGTRAVYRADQSIVGRFELYSVPVDGNGPAVRLSATPVAGGDVDPAPPLVTPDGARVLYRADALTDFEIELFSVPTDGSAAPVRLNAPMPHAGFVDRPRLTREGTQVLYTADQEVDDRHELYVAPVDGSAPATKVSGAVVDGGDVYSIYEARAGRAMWAADAVTDGQMELFAGPLDGSASPVRLSGSMIAGAQAGYAQLSPDGTRVIFDADREVLQRRELWGVPFDGSAAPVRLSPPLETYGRTYSAQFRPDGGVAFRADAPVLGHFAAWTTFGGTPVALTPELPLAPVVGDVSAFAWSADGGHVLYGAELLEPGSWSATSLRLADRHESSTPAGSTVSGFLLPPHSARFAYTTFFIGDEFPYPVAESLWSAPLDDATQAVLVAGSTDVGAVRFTADEYALVALSSSGYRIDPLGWLVLAPLDGSSAARDLATPTSRPSYVWPLEHAPRAGRALFGLFDLNASENGLFAADLAGGPPVPLGSPQHALATVTGLALRAADELALFVSDQAAGGRQELFAVPADGSRVLRRLHPPLPLGGDVDGAFRVSPDGARVVFRADAELDGVFELYVTRVADGVVTKLSGTLVAGGDVALPFENEASFWIGPDGARVVFLADRALDGVTELWSVPLDGSAAPVRLHAPLADTRDAVGAAHFTPDGARVVFAAELTAEGVFELLSAPADGGGPTLVLNAPFPPGGGLVASDSLGTFGSVALAPGGRHAFYLAEQEQDGVVELYSVPVDASRAPLRWNAPLVAGGDVTAFAVGPTPGAVLYRADQDEDEVFELYLSVFPAAPPPRQGSAAPGASVTTTVDLP